MVSMTKLNAVIALEKGTRTETYQTVTKLHHDVQKTALLNGISRTYQPLDDEGEQFPPESTRVQLTVEDVLAQIAEATTRLFDLTLTKDVANTGALGTIKIGSQVIAENVPVTYLLFLEKQLTDIATIIAKLPTLDPAETWHYDENTGLFATEPTRTVKSKKIPRNHVKAAATDKHPAQVEVWMEDVMVGHWTTVKFSGAYPAAKVAVLRDRVRVLQNAVKVAREEANSIQVSDRKIGETIFNHLFSAL